ncbi:lytic transglycosylase, partial [Stenotrophomonas maltophilia]
AGIFQHPQQYRVELPKNTAQPATLRLAQAPPNNEQTNCQGSHGTRHGYMRALRNHNPPEEAEGWIPAGTQIKAPTRL